MPLGKDMKPLISPPVMSLVSLLFYNDGFGIKWRTKVDMSLNIEKPIYL